MRFLTSTAKWGAAAALSLCLGALTGAQQPPQGTSSSNTPQEKPAQGKTPPQSQQKPVTAPAAAAKAAAKKKAKAAQGKTPPQAQQKPATAPAPAAKAPAKKKAKAGKSAKSSAKLAAKPPAGAPAPTVAKVRVVRGRDPFQSLIAVHSSTGGGHLPPGKAGLVVGGIRLDGTVRAPSGMIAVVSNPEQRVYFIREGDQLYDGSVEKIDMDEVMFREHSKDAFGRPVERMVTKRLYPTAGEQQ